MLEMLPDRLDERLFKKISGFDGGSVASANVRYTSVIKNEIHGQR